MAKITIEVEENQYQKILDLARKSTGNVASFVRLAINEKIANVEVKKEE